MILLTRKAEFSASHYYWNEAWSAEENARVFGKCSNRNGHGHNYTLEVTIAGEVDPVTGFVVDLKQLKDVMEREVVSAYDHRHLNLEVPEFKTAQPTTENIAVREAQSCTGCECTKWRICLLTSTETSEHARALRAEVSAERFASALFRIAERCGESECVWEMRESLWAWT
jgi:6-pyruvoyltetrahydropterin/6-carboxytetrahydropterin synthase